MKRCGAAAMHRPTIISPSVFVWLVYGHQQMSHLDFNSFFGEIENCDVEKAHSLKQHKSQNLSQQIDTSPINFYAAPKPRLTDGAEVEEEGQVSAAGQAGAGQAELVEEGVCAGLQRGQPGDRRVLQQAGA